MELIDVTVTELTRRSRSVRVSHNDTQLTRGLAFGEDVILRDTTGDFYAATVEDVHFELDDTVYRVSIGVRMPEEMAQSKLGLQIPQQRTETTPEFVDMDRLLHLLGEVRRQSAKTSVPAQAARAALRSLRSAGTASLTLGAPDTGRP
jgi:hypothetical protein